MESLRRLTVMVESLRSDRSGVVVMLQVVKWE